MNERVVEGLEAEAQRSLCFLNLGDVAAQLAEGALTARRLTQAVLDRARRLEPDVNAYIEIRADQALAAAEASDRRRAEGRALGPLDGVPYALKDLLDVAGWATTGGAAVLAAGPQPRDSHVAAKLRAAGAVLIGKTNLHELAYGVTSENPHFGPVRNPWALNRSPGGSSGGSAAAVAAGTAAFAIGTDTGCSVRHPAHCCGIVGFKPSHGAVGMTGVAPLVRQLDHVGPLTRSVRDAALVFDAIAGFDAEDPFSAPPGPAQQAAAAQVDAVLAAGGLDPAAFGAPPGPLRIAALSPAGFGYGEREVIEAAARAAETVAEAIGGALSLLEPPRLEQARRAAGRLFAGDPSAAYGAALRAAPERFGADVREKIEAGLRVSAGALAAAQQEARRFARAIDRAMEEGGLAALATPTCGAAAPLLGPAGRRAADLATVNCTPFNVSGQPAISIPCGATADGLPLGLMLVARRGRDAPLLALAALAEQALAASGRWAGARPAL